MILYIKNTTVHTERFLKMAYTPCTMLYDDMEEAPLMLNGIVLDEVTATVQSDCSQYFTPHAGIGTIIVMLPMAICQKIDEKNTEPFIFDKYVCNVMFTNNGINLRRTYAKACIDPYWACTALVVKYNDMEHSKYTKAYPFGV